MSNLLAIYLKHKKYFRLLLIFLIFYSVASILLFFVEKGVDSECQNIFDAFWMNIVFILSGFENYGPKTVPGKIISLISFIVGLSFIAALTGKFASIFVIKSQEEARMPVTNNFITICNWHEGGEKIVKEIHSPAVQPDTEILVITDQDVNELQLKRNKEFKNVYFVRSDPTLHSVLINEKVNQSRSVIILANNSNPDADANTALIALAITKISTGDVRPRIVAESINHRKMEHLYDAGVDEIICASDYEYGIIAQCALFGKLSQVYHELLSYSDDSVEFYIVDSTKIPEKIYGKTFTETSEMFLKIRDVSPVILVGIIRNGKVILNPTENASKGTELQIGKIQNGDNLIVLAYTYADINSLENI